MHFRVADLDSFRISDALGESVAKGMRALRRRGYTAAQFVREMTPRRWFLLCLALLFFAFFLVLLIQPSGVGRGGR